MDDFPSIIYEYHQIRRRNRVNNESVLQVVRHGFPDEAKCLAYDPVQRLIAIGTGQLLGSYQ